MTERYLDFANSLDALCERYPPASAFLDSCTEHGIPLHKVPGILAFMFMAITQVVDGQEEVDG